MKKNIELCLLLSHAGDRDQKVTSFALLCLGIIESLNAGHVSAAEAMRIFFNADNCLFVRKGLKQKIADQIMSRGVQLPDLVDFVPAEDAQKEFHYELASMRSLALKLLEKQRVAA
jgi:hypothetical protein